MSSLTISDSLINLFQSGSSTQSARNAVSTLNGSDFTSTLSFRMAALRAETFNTLLGSSSDNSNFDVLTQICSSTSALSDTTGMLSGLSTSGRNLSLFDPESAFTMMSIINERDVTYKAQFSELSEMESAVATLQQAGQGLGDTTVTLDNERIKDKLQAFADQYNAWITRFDGTVQQDGVLAGTQAAEVSLYELEQSIENIFNGAKDGFHGLRDLGFSIDQTTNLASLDSTQLEAALNTNKSGVVNTITEFSANFVKSAELLDSENNFIPNRLNNLDRVIDYITENKSSLQAEFGLGNTATPSAQVANALAAYNRMFAA